MERTTTVIAQADVERQLEICDRIAQMTAQLEHQPLAFVDTYGCQQNEADSERIRGYLRRMGYGFTKDEEQAKIVRLIYRLFLQGRTPTWIAEHLTQKGIQTPGEKTKWRSTTILSILQNEKYKGDALLQKCYTV